MKTKIIFIILLLMTIKTVKSQAPIEFIWNDTTILYICPYDNYDTIQWGPSGVDITAGNGAEDEGYGMPNTIAIVEQLGDNGGVPYPAKICDTLTAFGYTDWYLPARWELDFMAVRQDSMIGLYRPSGIYWGSYEFDSLSAYTMYFYYPNWMGSSSEKFGQCKCRCVRRE